MTEDCINVMLLTVATNFCLMRKEMQSKQSKTELTLMLEKHFTEK